MYVDNYLNYCDLLHKGCEPLFKFTPIKKFSYIEAKQDGQYIVLSSDRQVYEEFVKEGLYENCVLETLALYHIPGVYLNDYHRFDADLADIQKKYINFYENFDYGHAFFMVNHEIVNDELQHRIYVFESDIKTQGINHEYVNSVDLLKKFNRYFHDFSSKQMILPYSSIDQTCWDNYINLVKRSKQDAQEAFTKKLVFQQNLMTKIKLTRREADIAYWYLKGKTALETSYILGISFRTVENTFHTMKIKLGCASKSEFLLKYADLV